MISIGNLDIDKLYVGDDEVEKIYIGNDLVWENSVTPITDTVLNLRTQNQTSATLNIYKTNTDATEIYLNDTLYTTSTNSGTQDISVIIPSGTSTLKISGGGFYFDSYCLGSSANNTALLEIIFGSNYGNIIGVNAFYGCSNLTSITIPKNIKQIGNSSFYNCLSLVDINWNARELTTALTSSNKIFYKAGTNGNGITVTFGNNVTSIPKYLFYASTTSTRAKIVKVIIGQSVISVGDSVFRNCSDLSDLTFGSNIITIGAYAFYGCSGLIGTLTIPDRVEDIGNYAFGNCSNLTNVLLSNNLKSLGGKAFDGCPNIIYNQYDNAYYLGNNDNLYIALIKSIDTTIISCIINSSTRVIGGVAFDNCTSLENITIHNNIVGIGNSAFSNCSSIIGTLTIPNSVEILGNSAFSHCSGITSVVLGNGLTNIGELAFSTCENITSITFPNKKINDIGRSVFYNCTGLTGTLTIPNSVEKISTTMFYGCSGLTDIIIEEGVIEIDTGAFQYCSALENISIPNSVMKIAGNLFYECPNIIYNQYDNGYYLGNNSNPNLIFIKAIDTSLSSCIINQNTKFIYQSACSSYSALTGILTIPDNVIDIGAFAFDGCTGLTSVTIGSGVTNIGSSAFSGCNGITGTLTIPNSVTSIGQSAFSQCTGLTSVTIGIGVTSIGFSAFYGCSGLAGITINATTPPTLTSAYVFDNTNNCPIYVPAASVTAYQTAPYWNSLSSRIQAKPV